MRSERTLVTIVCDGCGAEQSGTIDSAWKHVAVTVSTPFGLTDARHGDVDLCPKCLATVNVPGLDQVEED